MNYYKELPNDYKEYRKIDATDKKFTIIVSIISIFIVIIVFLLCFFIKGIKHIEINNRIDFIYLLLFVLGFVIYTILHELIHGLFYKIFTKEKLKFGLKLSCAYCGIPNIYVKKIPMIVIALAPFIIFSIVFVLSIIFTHGLLCILLIILFSMHVSGCMGDLYVSFLLIFNKGDLLINDTGPVQTIYRRNNNV